MPSPAQAPGRPAVLPTIRTANLPLSQWRTPCIEKLDRLAWTCAVTVTAYGVRVGVRSNDRALLERLCAELPPGWEDAPQIEATQVLMSARLAPPSPRPGTRNYHMLYAESGRVARTLDLDDVIGAFFIMIHPMVGAYATGCAFLRAGAVAWQGRAIVIPGRPASGTTSLVRALVAAGAQYLSSDYTLIGEDGRILPYPKALLIRGEEGAPHRRLTPAEIGAVVPATPVPLGLIAAVKYSPTRRARLRALTSSEAAMELLNHAVGLRSKPALTLALVHKATQHSAAVKGIRNEADAFVAELLQRSTQEASGPGGPSPKFEQTVTEGTKTPSEF